MITSDQVIKERKNPHQKKKKNPFNINYIFYFKSKISGVKLKKNSLFGHVMSWCIFTQLQFNWSNFKCMWLSLKIIKIKEIHLKEGDVIYWNLIFSFPFWRNYWNLKLTFRSSTVQAIQLINKMLMIIVVVIHTTKKKKWRRRRRRKKERKKKHYHI